ncbi:TolB-like translocation protein [Plantactinospora endophytica]|uniref:WD40 repeat protein n=1 Tax=Plantactinospora endophytica TaxID=673535 RepID=A0ABQ4E7Y1_9ACTN|nr:hypothetical protein [Plantactinospora endophytica]GIG90392.1 hypothetical protein Pen02_53280 [Plantactinospora endophytica]
MSTQISDVLRVALDEGAEAVPPTGLAAAALHRARRQRLARRAASGFLAVVAVLVGGTVHLGSSGTGDLADDVAALRPPGGMRPMVVTAYSGIRDPKVADGSPAFNYSLLLDRKTGNYDRMPYRSVIPAPDGTRALVRTGDNSEMQPSRFGILEIGSGEVRWIPGFGTGSAGFPGASNGGHWSPDGRTLLFDYSPRTGAEPGFVLVDAETLHPTKVTVPGLPGLDSQGIGPVWAPDGRQVVVNLSHSEREDQPDVVTGLRFYDLAGRRVRDLPVTATLRSGSAYAPDGSRMALSAAGQGTPLRLLLTEVTSGKVLRTIELDRPATLLGWHDDEHLVLRFSPGPGDAGRPAGHDELAVVDLTGRVTERLTFPAETALGVAEVHLGSSADLPGGAARITF